MLMQERTNAWKARIEKDPTAVLVTKPTLLQFITEIERLWEFEKLAKETGIFK